MADNLQIILMKIILALNNILDYGEIVFAAILMSSNTYRYCIFYV